MGDRGQSPPEHRAQSAEPHTCDTESEQEHDTGTKRETGAGAGREGQSETQAEGQGSRHRERLRGEERGTESERERREDSDAHSAWGQWILEHRPKLTRLQRRCRDKAIRTLRVAGRGDEGGLSRYQ